MKQEKWIEQLHDKLAEHETPAPADLWDDIEAALPDGGQHFQALPPRKARFKSLRRWAAAAAVAAFLGGGGLFWWSQEDAESEMLISMAEDQQDVDELQGGGEDSTLGSNLSIAQTHTDNIQTLPPTPPLERLQVGERRSGMGREGATPEEPAVNEPLPEGPTANEPLPEEPTVKEPLHEEPSVMPGERRITEPLPERPIKKPRPRLNRQPSLGLYAMNSFNSQDNSNAVIMSDALAKSYADTYAAGMAASRQAPIFLTGFEEHEHHYQPLSFGLSVSYPLTLRLSLTSGVVYSRLRSEFTQTIHSQHFSKEQMLHYVGIPLSVNYRLWQYKVFTAYLSTGMQADWNVKAQLKAEGVEQEMSRDRLQWSVNGSLGLQYELMPQLSLYAEPGINYHFDNGSTVQNFYKDKPTNLKLQVGVRFDLSK